MTYCMHDMIEKTGDLLHACMHVIEKTGDLLIACMM